MARPRDRPARILINRSEVGGRQRGQLLADLAHRRAAYRIEILCGGSQDVTIRVHVGERQADRKVRYWSGAGFIKGTTLVSYTGLQDADENSFWFQ
ncbi:MAG: hypothetical protein ACJ8FF_02065 [Sphingomicrobium sp.]